MIRPTIVLAAAAVMFSAAPPLTAQARVDSAGSRPAAAPPPPPVLAEADSRSLSRLRIGSRVRVSHVPICPEWPCASSEIIPSTVGTFRGATDSALVLTVGREGTERLYLRENVTGLDVSVGRHRNAGKGGLIGLLAGAGMGALMGLASGNDVCHARPDEWFGCMFTFTAKEKAEMGATVFGVTGGLVGLVVGALVQSDDWEVVRIR